MKNLFFFLFIFTTLTASAKSGFAPVNGIKMYYEIHGKGGLPLVMIHGGGSTIDSAFSKLIPLLSKGRQIIALEEQGHGRTQGRPDAVSFIQTADDVAELMKFLKINQADVLGFSNGASSAMQLSIRHPKLVRKLVFISSFTKRSGASAGFWDNFKQADKCSLPPALKTAFLKVNPDKELMEEMCKKDSDRMRNFPETSDEEVKKIQSPTLVLMGDKDIVTVEHGRELVRLLPKGQLAVLPGAHGDFLGDASMGEVTGGMPEVTAKLVEAFLDT